MKKFLSLVLALVMTMSLVTVSAGAAYKDADDIEYKEAVDVLAAIDVMSGDETGFRPNDDLKRSEAAKIIAYLQNGAKVAAGLTAPVAPFADVAASHWAAGYIADLVDEGILSGVGDNKFNPDGKLTGFAYLKMLLVCLGYDATIEGFVNNNNWYNNVMDLADEMELTKGNDDFNGNANVTREEAALYTLNALKAPMVKYADKGTNITINGVEIASGASEAEYVTKVVDKEEVIVTYMDKNYSKLSYDDGEDMGDDFGRPGIYWEYDGEEIGTYGEAADYVLVAKKDTTLAKLIEDNKLEKKITTWDAEKLSFDAADIDCGTVIELWVSKKAVTADTSYSYALVQIDKVNKFDSEDMEVEDYEASVYYTFKAKFDVDTALADDVTYVDALNEDGEDDADYAAIGEFEKGDVLLVTMYNGEAMDFAVAESVEGVVSKKGTNALTIDGTKYAAETGVAYDFDDSYVYYLDANGIIIDSEEGEKADKDLEYAYVLKVEAQDKKSSLISAKENAAKVKVMYTDGEIEVLNYALYENDDEDIVYDFLGAEEEAFVAADFEALFENEDGDFVGGWYAYTLNKDGEVTFEEFDADEAGVKSVTLAEDERNVTSTIRATTSTTVKVLDEDGKVVKSYTGYKNFPEEALADTALVIFGSSKTVAEEIYIYDADAKADDENVEVALFVSKGDTVKGGREVTFYVAGEKDTYIVKTEALEALDGATAGMLYTFDLNKDGEIKAIEAADYEFGTVDVAADDFFTLVDAEETEIEIAEGCKFYQLSKNAKTVSEAEELSEDVLVVYIVNEDGEATEIFMHKDICTGWCPSAE